MSYKEAFDIGKVNVRERSISLTKLPLLEALGRDLNYSPVGEVPFHYGMRHEQGCAGRREESPRRGAALEPARLGSTRVPGQKQGVKAGRGV